VQRLEPLDPSTGGQARRRLVPVMITFVAWIAAYLVVMALLVTFGPQIAALPVALRAMVISGVVVTVMVNLVMPILNRPIARWLAGTRTRPQLDSSDRAPERHHHMNDTEDQTWTSVVDTPGWPADPGVKDRQPSHMLVRLWAAHPVHPPLAHLVVGAYGTATILAFTGVLGVAESDAAKGWWLALVVGLLATIPASASGLTEFLTLGRHHPARPAVVRHLVLALATLPCFGAAAVLGHQSYQQGDIAAAPLALTAAGFVLLTMAGFAGGRLIFSRGLRVKAIESRSTGRLTSP